MRRLTERMMLFTNLPEIPIITGAFLAFDILTLPIVFLQPGETVISPPLNISLLLAMISAPFVAISLMTAQTLLLEKKRKPDRDFGFEQANILGTIGVVLNLIALLFLLKHLSLRLQLAILIGRVEILVLNNAVALAILIAMVVRRAVGNLYYSEIISSRADGERDKDDD